MKQGREGKKWREGTKIKQEIHDEWWFAYRLYSFVQLLNVSSPIDSSWLSVIELNEDKGLWNDQISDRLKNIDKVQVIQKEYKKKKLYFKNEFRKSR